MVTDTRSPLEAGADSMGSPRTLYPTPAEGTRTWVCPCPAPAPQPSREPRRCVSGVTLRLFAREGSVRLTDRSSPKSEKIQRSWGIGKNPSR
jgi:hypothetical protein